MPQRWKALTFNFIAPWKSWPWWIFRGIWSGSKDRGKTKQQHSPAPDYRASVWMEAQPRTSIWYRGIHTIHHRSISPVWLHSLTQAAAEHSPRLSPRLSDTVLLPHHAWGKSSKLNNDTHHTLPGPPGLPVTFPILTLSPSTQTGVRSNGTTPTRLKSPLWDGIILAEDLYTASQHALNHLQLTHPF